MVVLGVEVVYEPIDARERKERKKTTKERRKTR